MAAAFTTTATSLEGQFMELAREIQELELAIPVETRPNNITITPDFEALVCNITVALPITLSGTGASITAVAAPYLT